MRLRIIFFIFTLIFILNNNVLSATGTSFEFQFIKSITTFKKPIGTIAFSPDDRLIVAGANDGNVKIWEFATSKQVKALIKHPNQILSMSFSPNGNLIAVGLDSGLVALWDINYKERVRTLKGHQGKVLSVRFNKDGSLLATGSDDKTVRVWDMKSGDEIKTLTGHFGSINSVSFSPDSKFVASGSSDGNVKIWEISSGKDAFKIKPSVDAGVNSIAFSPDGKSIASGLNNGVVNLWDIESNTEKMSFVGQKATIGLDDCLAISPDGKVLASAATDGSMIIWEALSGSIVSQQKPNRTGINSIIFNSDGKMIAVAGNDGAISIWKIRVTESLKIKLTTAYDGWTRGILKLEAELIGMADKVAFQYSIDGAKWNDIIVDNEPPYSVDWDTRPVFQGVAKNVQIRVFAERQPGLSAVDINKGNVSIDNEPPKTSQDYDGQWRTSDFFIGLSASDGDGIGLSSLSYKINYGAKKDLKRDSQPKITDQGVNTLEYWAVDKLDNEEEHKILSDIKLDKTPPAFADWYKEPQVLSKDYKGNFRLSVRISDDGSGLEGNIPQIDYHISAETSYDGYENMTASGDFWSFDVPEPAGGWSKSINKPLFYKVKCQDVAGNIGESAEQQELIGSNKVPPIVKISNVFKNWEGGTIKLNADASDTDGNITKVWFEYSLDGVKWNPIKALQQPPYVLDWNTKSVFSDVTKNIKIQANAQDSDGLMAKNLSPAFNIDNQPPNTSHDYDDLWHKSDFGVNLNSDDGNGSGISKIVYKINGGYERIVQTDGQPKIDEQGENSLEYWAVDNAGNEETHKTLASIKLDRLAPLVESMNVKKNGNKLDIEVKISDKLSGVNALPQIDYRIGSGQYSGSKDMLKDKDIWKYIVDLTGDDVVGKDLSCKISVRDLAGNLSIKTFDSKITGEATSSVVAETKPNVEPQTDQTKIEIKPQVETQQPKTSEIITEKATETVVIPKAKPQGEKSSIIWTVKAPDTNKVGDKLDLEGQLNAKIRDSELIKITITDPNDKVYVSQAYTDVKGNFDFSVILDTAGQWKAATNWDGNEKYQSAESNIMKINVISETEPVVKQEKKRSSLLGSKSIIIGVLAIYLLIIGLSRK
jgi:WD40 repeat protein